VVGLLEFFELRELLVTTDDASEEHWLRLLDVTLSFSDMCGLFLALLRPSLPWNTRAARLPILA
jgi:hypothetical protein